MTNRSSSSARVFAVTALVAAFVVAIVAIAGSVGEEDSNRSERHGGDGSSTHRSQPEQVPATYEVKTGDTLISIARRVGVPVARIQELNPEVDPQILVAGEQLKLR
jgi:LysM repeat protein